MRINRLVATVTTTLLLATLAACGSDEPAADQSSATSSPAEEPTTEVSTAEEPEESEAPVQGEEVDPAALLDDMKAAVKEHESAHLTLETTGGAQGMSGEGDVSYAGDSTSMQMAVTMPQMGNGEMEMRLVDEIMYLAMPPMTPKGKFIKLDTNDPNSPFGDMSGMLSGDPLSSFEAFDAGLKKVEHVGQEDVDGEQLDHYVLTVDAAKAAEAQGQQLPSGAPETVTYDLWLDDQSLMRRIEFEQAGGGLVMTMSDWGKPVTVKAPPASDVMQMPQAPPAS